MSRHFSTLNISETRLSHSYYMRSIGSHMRSITWWHFQWPWRTLNPVFKVTAFLKSNISNTVRFTFKYTTLIGNHSQYIEWYHFQWPWVTYDPDFKVTTFLKSNIGKQARLIKDKVTIAQEAKYLHMEWYYVWRPWLTSKCVAQVYQHQLSFLFNAGTGLWKCFLK